MNCAEALVVALDDSKDWFEAEEVWKLLPGFPGYEVSDRGRFRSYWRSVGLGRGKGSKPVLVNEPRILKPSVDKRDGRLGIRLCRDGKQHNEQVAHWMLRAFVGDWPGKGYDCRHLDGNPSNNDLSNLAWGTRSENMVDRFHHGRDGSAKLSPDDIPVIRFRLANGDKQEDIARDFGVNQPTISRIKTGCRWAHAA